jgi:hypothetical protein
VRPLASGTGDPKARRTRTCARDRDGRLGSFASVHTEAFGDRSIEEGQQSKMSNAGSPWDDEDEINEKIDR